MSAERKLRWVLMIAGAWAVMELLVALLPFDDLGTIVLL